jgi:hypothetical protein
VDYLDKRPALRKMDMRFGTWNLRSLNRASLIMTVTKEIKVGGWTILKWILEREDGKV